MPRPIDSPSPPAPRVVVPFEPLPPPAAMCDTIADPLELHECLVSELTHVFIQSPPRPFEYTLSFSTSARCPTTNVEDWSLYGAFPFCISADSTRPSEYQSRIAHSRLTLGVYEAFAVIYNSRPAQECEVQLMCDPFINVVMRDTHCLISCTLLVLTPQYEPCQLRSATRLQ